jgi:cyclase
MPSLRLIARLDIKGRNLIKGMHLEGLRVIGDPQQFSEKYYRGGIDELIYIDAVASLYGRNHLVELISHTAKQVFVPITVGGGIRSLEDASELLRAGADKVAVNTAAMQDPSLIDRIAQKFGSQCFVLSVEAKKIAAGVWEAYNQNGREPTGRNVIDWVMEGVRRGAGEVLLTSIDQEGTQKGFDVELTKAVSDVVPVPVIACGGMGCVQDLIDVVVYGHADAVAMAAVLHYGKTEVPIIKSQAKAAGLNVRIA